MVAHARIPTWKAHKGCACTAARVCVHACVQNACCLAQCNERYTGMLWMTSARCSKAQLEGQVNARIIIADPSGQHGSEGLGEGEGPLSRACRSYKTECVRISGKQPPRIQHGCWYSVGYSRFSPGGCTHSPVHLPLPLMPLKTLARPDTAPQKLQPHHRAAGGATLWGGR